MQLWDSRADPWKGLGSELYTGPKTLSLLFTYSAGSILTIPAGPRNSVPEMEGNGETWQVCEQEGCSQIWCQRIGVGERAEVGGFERLGRPIELGVT